VIFLEETNARIESETEVKAYLQKRIIIIRRGRFVMSFHFAERAFTPDMFPYRKR